MNPVLQGYYKYVNKINYCVTYFVLYILFIYSLASYVIIFKFVKRSYSKVLLNFTKFKASSFFFESFTRIMRDFFNAFFQAYFICDYKKQITSLMASQVVYIFFCIYFRKNYINPFIFIFSTLYYVLFFLFNVILVVEYHHPKLFKNIDFNKIMEIYMLVMIALTFVISIVTILSSLIKLIKQIIKRFKSIERQNNIH